ncbi:MAG: hypothetical protein HDT26_02300 [Subdoligranulum sp.]|nr:hypothetical protein [Subdoligranulum sp.]
MADMALPICTRANRELCGLLYRECASIHGTIGDFRRLPRKGRGERHKINDNNRFAVIIQYYFEKSSALAKKHEKRHEKRENA